MRLRGMIVVALLLGAGLTGCIGSSDVSEEDVQAASVQDPPAELIEATEALEWEGHVGTYAYACPMVTCLGQGLPGQWDSLHELDTEPRPVAADLTLSWGSPTSDVNELAFGLLTNECDDGCDFIDWTRGTSPVQLSVTDIDLDENDEFNIVVWRPYHGAMVGGGGGAQTDFTVEGTVTVLKPAEA